jgi:hypothetical protein
MAYEARHPPVEALHPGTTPAGPIYGPSPLEIESVVEEVVREILKN